MVALANPLAPRTEALLARLVDTALPLVLEHGLPRPSVDVELELWEALEQTARVQNHLNRRLPAQRSALDSAEELQARLVDAAFRVALGHGLRDSFLDLELDLWHAFQEAAPERDLSALLDRPTASPARRARALPVA